MINNIILYKLYIYKPSNFIKPTKKFYKYYFDYIFKNEFFLTKLFLINFINKNFHNIIPFAAKVFNSVDNSYSFKIDFFIFKTNSEKLRRNRFFSLKLIFYCKRFYNNNFNESLKLVKDRFFFELYKDKDDFGSF